MDAGLLEEAPIDVNGVKVAPRDVLHTLMDPKLRAKPGEPDLVIVRVLAKGKKGGHKAHVVLDMIDRAPGIYYEIRMKFGYLRAPDPLPFKTSVINKLPRGISGRVFENRSG